MFELNVRFQIAAILFFAVLLIDFLRAKKIPTAANRHFRHFMFLSGVDLILDVITVYTVSNTDKVPESINILAHRAFFISIAAMVESFYRYVCSLDSDKGTEVRAVSILRKVPFLAAVLSSAFLPVSFVSGEKYAYSQGAAVLALFMIAAVIMLLTVAKALVSRIPKSSKLMIVMGIGVWTAVCIIQYLFPNMLLTGMGTSIMVCFVYLSLENPAEYVDLRTGCYNRFALDRVLREKVHSSESFVVIHAVLDGLKKEIAHLGYEESLQVMRRLGEVLSTGSGSLVYSFFDNSFIMFSPDLESAEKLCSEMSERLFREKQLDLGGKMLRGHYDLLRFPDTAHNAEEIYSILRYSAEHPPKGVRVNIVGKDTVAACKREEEMGAVIREALEKKKINLYFRPVYGIKDGRLAGAELFVTPCDWGSLSGVTLEEVKAVSDKNNIHAEIGCLARKMTEDYIEQTGLCGEDMRFIEINIPGGGVISLDGEETISICRVAAELPVHLEELASGLWSGETLIIKVEKDLVLRSFDKELSREERERSRVILHGIIALGTELGAEICIEGGISPEDRRHLSGKGAELYQSEEYLTGEEFAEQVRKMKESV